MVAEPLEIDVFSSVRSRWTTCMRRVTGPVGGGRDAGRRALGDLPLAIEQASRAGWSRRGCPADTYVEMLDKRDGGGPRRAGRAGRLPDLGGQRPADLSFDRLSQRSPARPGCWSCARSSPPDPISLDCSTATR